MVAFRARSPREAAWWDRATPQERVAFFLGAQRGMGHAWPTEESLRALRARFQTIPEPPEPARPKAPNRRTWNKGSFSGQGFYSTDPCAAVGCDNPIGDLARGGGRPPKHCPEHRGTRSGR